FDLGKVKKIDKDQKIVVYCSIGVRSENIGVKLIKAGYKNVENLYGGIFDWKNKDFPVVDALGKSTEEVHAYSKHWSKWLRNAEKIY
ncbi:MAG: rhodanese-like domain-containing protein, partial [Gramella sp.]|nr:rhodanese-like domain-containing protein [Christiangramia sp.]